jgi:hypothetical protein
MAESDTIQPEKLYEVLKAAYDEETARYGELNDRGKYYLTIVGLYGAVLVFKNDSIQTPASSLLYHFFAAVIGVALGIAVLCIAISARIRAYEAPFRPADIIANLRTGDLSPVAFYAARTADIAVATERNIQRNDERSWWLRRALYALVVAILLTLIIIGATVLNPKGVLQ